GYRGGDGSPSWTSPVRPGSPLSRLHREEAPLPGHALKGARAAVDEPQARTGDEVLHGAGDEHFRRRGLGCHACAGVHGDATHVVAHELALPGVKACPDLDPERADGVADGAGAADGPRRAVEGGEEAVAGRLDLAAAEACELPAHERVMGG